MDEQASTKRAGKKPADDNASKGQQTENARDKAAHADYEAEHDRPGRRRSSEARANAFNTLAWLIEGATGLAEELRHNDLGLSEEFWVHLYAARREGLMAARAAIDSLLVQTERESQKAHAHSERQARRGEVNIQ